MNKSLLVLFSLVAMLTVAVGCGGGNDVTEPMGTQLSLTPITTDPAADEAVVFSVTASNAQAHIKSVTVDYTDDGNWDDTRTMDSASVLEAFTWIYHAEGVYRVRAEARDANDTPTTTTVQVTVAPSRSVNVSILLVGHSAEGGPCYGFGPQALCAGCSETLGPNFPTAVRHSLGLRQHGEIISVSQGFAQGPYANGQDVLYGCDFGLRIVSGTAPYEITLATSGCGTTSKTNPAALSCTAAAGGVIP